MIPKTIHYCWFGNNQKNDLIIRCMESWSKIMPEFQIKEWNEGNSPVEIPYCKSAYDRKLWSKVSNFVRLWALFHEGGIYLDTDFEVLKNLDRFRFHDCFLGFQRIEERPGWVNNGIIGAHKGNNFLEKCMSKTISIFEDTGEFILSPHVTTIVLKEMGLTQYGLQTIQDVTLYPIEYFYPYSWLEKYDPVCVKEITYAVHHWNMSWVNKLPSE